MLRDALLLDVRGAAAAVLLLAAARKLLRPEAVHAELRALWPVRGAAAVVTVAIAGIVEAAPSWLVVLVPGGRVAVVVAGAFVAFTVVAVLGVRRTGSCGCVGLPSASVRSVVARNAVLFGAMAAGVGAGPTEAELLQGEASVVAAVPLVVPAAALAALGWRVLALRGPGLREWRAFTRRLAAAPSSGR